MTSTKVSIIRGALIRLDGDVAAFLAWCMDNRVYGRPVGATGSGCATGFYTTADVLRIVDWAQANGCRISDGEL